MLHGHGEGTIISVEGDVIRVMLTEGIEIPVPRKHLVLVRKLQEPSPVKTELARESNFSRSSGPGMLFLERGLYLAGVPTGSNELEFYFLNQSDYEIWILMYRLARPVNQFHASFQIAPGKEMKVPGTFPKKEIHHLTGLHIQFLKFHPDRGEAQSPGEFRLGFSKVLWEKIKQQIPMLDKEGYVLQVDEDQIQPDASELKAAMFRSSVSPSPQPSFREKIREVDLHMEKLSQLQKSLSPCEILPFQIQHFEKELDRAIADQLEKIIFIHGAGNGVLRQEIHKKLSRNQGIRYFKDAQKERFGYGATEVGL